MTSVCLNNQNHLAESQADIPVKSCSSWFFPTTLSNSGGKSPTDLSSRNCANLQNSLQKLTLNQSNDASSVQTGSMSSTPIWEALQRINE
jgi:hypothetical protein